MSGRVITIDRVVIDVGIPIIRSRIMIVRDDRVCLREMANRGVVPPRAVVHWVNVSISVVAVQAGMVLRVAPVRPGASSHHHPGQHTSGRGIGPAKRSLGVIVEIEHIGATIQIRPRMLTNAELIFLCVFCVLSIG